MQFSDIAFGQISIDGKHYGHDVYIINGKTIKKRNKKLSPKVSGHRSLGPEEIKVLIENDPSILFIGKGQYGSLPIPESSRDILKKSGVIVVEKKLPDIVGDMEKKSEKDNNWNAILHLTC